MKFPFNILKKASSLYSRVFFHSRTSLYSNWFPRAWFHEAKKIRNVLWYYLWNSLIFEYKSLGCSNWFEAHLLSCSPVWYWRAAWSWLYFWRSWRSRISFHHNVVKVIGVGEKGVQEWKSSPESILQTSKISASWERMVRSSLCMISKKQRSEIIRSFGHRWYLFMA